MSNHFLAVQFARAWAVFALFACVGKAAAQRAAPIKSYAFPTAAIDVAPAQMRVDLNGPGPLEFSRIQTVLPTKSGGFLVANGASVEIRYFDETGKFIRSTGRKGGGPNEYSAFGAVVLLAGDTLAVLDPFARRVSFLSPDGKFLRSVSIAASPDSLGSASLIIAMPNGSLAVGFSEVIRMAPQPAAVTFYDRYYALNADGKFAKTNLRLAHSEHFVQATIPERGGVAYYNRAFGKEGSIASTRTSLLTGNGASWSIDERSATGNVVVTHTLNRAVEPVTAADKAAFRASEIRGRTHADTVLGEKEVAEMPWPTAKPAYRHIEADNANHVWLQQYPALNETQSMWIRLDPATKRASAIRMPARFRATAFTAQRVYGVWRDDDDVEHVRVYALPVLK